MEAIEPRSVDSTAALVDLAIGGDRGAYGLLVERHWQTLVRLARSIVGDSEAEDAVQEALVAAWTRLGSLRDAALFPAWIRRMVVRRCLRGARWWSRRVPLAEVAEPHTGGGDPTAEIDLERTLAHLAPRQRAVMHLTVVEGMSDREIGQVMGLVPASVRAHRRRARHRLTRLLEGAQRS